jgi:hypothetical protein
MEEYLNNSGNSPIEYYEIKTQSIIIWFKGGKSYSYSYEGGAGKNNVEIMKELAVSRSGLSVYITKNVRFDYDK